MSRSTQCAMAYKILMYCPDHHITYNLNTLEETGVGGGVTARIRMAHALAALGHKVSAYVNCPEEETLRGVEYRHYTNLTSFQSDIAIFSTSGGELDLKEIASQKVDARLKILMVHGVGFPKNIRLGDVDYIYALSNFVREITIRQWGASRGQVFVSYRGVCGQDQPRNLRSRNDPYNLVYFGHPSKGLDAAVRVLQTLRRQDRRYFLHIYGGNRLWGIEESPPAVEAGMFYYGLLGQKKLAAVLPQMGFSLNLQEREEPFGMVVTESMQAGCIVLASPVGAFPELIRDGWNGFLIPGRPSEPRVWECAAEKILELSGRPELMASMQANAKASPLAWETIARSWTGHWDWTLHKNPHIDAVLASPNYLCPKCHGDTLQLADGRHCIDCGYYQYHPENEKLVQFISCRGGINE